MRVLLYHCLPFSLAHGGQQIQITRTLEALRVAGVEAQFLDWHRPDQEGDILHFFGRIPHPFLEHARQKGMKVVVSDLLAAQGARAAWRLWIEKLARRGIEAVSSARRTRQLSWTSYRMADACVALTEWEAHLLSNVFQVPPGRIHLVPNGVDDVFLNHLAAERRDWLLCVATIAPVKRVLEVAEAAILARTPIRFVGQAFSESDPYARRFRDVVQAHPGLLLYEGAIREREALARTYREARGFVLLSAWESSSLAALEAAAAECPLLLSDLPWAKSVFGQRATYCAADAPAPITATHLRAFYDHAPNLPHPPKPIRWLEVGQILKKLYETLSKPHAGNAAEALRFSTSA